MRRGSFFLALVLFLAVAGLALADAYDLSWHTAGAAGRAQGGPFVLEGGVAYAGGISSAPNWAVRSGFWVIPPTLFGDMDADCDVDIVDIMLVASRWNTSVGHPKYDPMYDLDSDGDIDIVDIMLVAARWNDHC